MRRNPLPLLRAAGLLASLSLLMLSSASRAELLANDSWISGQAVSFQGGFVSGETAAVRLTPTGPCPCQVDEVRFLFGGFGTTHDVTIRIWDDTALTSVPGALIHSETLSVTGTSDFLQTVDLRAAGVMVNGTFRVGLEFSHDGFPSVASDSDGINLGQNYIDEITFGWFDAAIFGVTGDWVIRAVVDSGTPGAGTLLANDGWISGQPAAFQGGFVAGETAAARLVPPGPCPCRFDKIQFLFGGAAGTHDVTFRIWDDSGLTDAPGAELYSTTLTITGSDEFMQEVDISAVGLMISGPVRVGLEFSHAGLPSVARDDDGILPDRNFVDQVPGGWAESSTLGLTGDWIIRGVLDSQVVASQGTLLANDSWLPSQAAAFQGGFAIGETAAARFVPAGPCPCRLDKVQFLFGGAEGTHDVTLHVWDDSGLADAPGAELYSTTLEIAGSDDFMQEIDLGVLGIMVNGPFRVGLEFSHAGLPSVARDTDGITPDRNFVDDGTLGWVESSTLGLTGDWILRAVLDVDAGVGDQLNNDTWVSGEAAAFQLGFVPDETAAARFVPTGPCPCTLDQIRFLFGGAQTSETVTLRIWDDGAQSDAPGAELYSAAIQLTGSDLFLQELDLTVAHISVNGPFRVGFEFQHAGPPSVARDDDGITAGRNFIEDSTLGWVDAATQGVTGDWIIRAVINSVPGFVLASDSFRSAAPANFGETLLSGDTAAVRLVPSGPCPCPIQDARFLLGGATGAEVVRLHIWDDSALTDAPGAELFSRDVSITPNDQALRVVDLQGEGVSADGPFRVGIELSKSGPPSVAVDGDGITPGRSFVKTPGGSWIDASTIGVAGDWVIRATIAQESFQVPALAVWGRGLLALLLAGAAMRQRLRSQRSRGSM